ncbi:MAG TPA: multiheme c-type cytochrome [bacterium]
MAAGKRKRTVWIGALSLLSVFFAWRMVRPLSIFVVDQRFERPMATATPEGLSTLSAKECGGCHRDIYREWAGSMHAQAWSEPYFQVDFTYDGSQQICLNCHTPLENQQENLVLGFEDREKFHPILKPNPSYDPTLRDEGVTCATCHVQDGRIVGPFESAAAPHPVTVRPDMKSGLGPCARCHVVTNGRWDAFYRVPPCGTVAEINERGQRPDCIGCHMPPASRPIASGGVMRSGRRHLFHGGHAPEMVKGALEVSHQSEELGSGRVRYVFTLTNKGAAHYLPTGTPDRHLTLDLTLRDRAGETIKHDSFRMKRYIMWRPFIVDVKDTRLPFGKPAAFPFEFNRDGGNPPSQLDVVVTYHLLDEKRRKKIGYANREPIAYPVYRETIALY